MFFLYLGAFPEDSEIFSYKLIHLLDVEGFIGKYDLRYNFSPSLRYFGSENKITVNAKISNYAGHILKSFSINPFWRLLFNIVASKDKFLHVVDSSFDPSDGNLKGQRRLCMHSNFLFNFKQVVESVRHDCAFHARSLLCFGPYHQYPMPLDVGFKLLRLLDALKVHFYIFPIEILNLVQLQYLALSYNGKLPTSISKFINLHFLIIHPRVSIRSCGAPSYVPVQIWDMQELKYVDIFGSNLPNPIFDSTLEKLSTLLGVSPNSCTREVLGKIPNIMKLGVQIELIPQDDQDCDQMNCTFLPDNLDTFKYSILNPAVKNGFIAPLTPLSMLPQTLRKLHLSGLGYPWKYMKIIGSLPILEVLKLRCYAFRGPKWESERESFLHLKLLVIEDSDLVWILLRSGFPKLMHLSLKHCYKLQDLHWPDYGLYTRTIELFNCSPSAVTSAKQLKQERQDHIGLNVFSDDEELQQIYHKILSPSK